MWRWLSFGVSLFLLPAWVWAEGVIVGDTCAVTWTAPTGPPVTRYHVYVSRTKGVYNRSSPTVVIQAPTTQSSCQAFGLTADGQYYAVVTAIGLNNKESPNSNEAPFVRDTSIPNAPTGFSVGP